MRRQNLIMTVDFDDVIVPTAVEMVNLYNSMFKQDVDVAHFYSEPNLETWGESDMSVIRRRIEQIIPIIDARAFTPTNDALWGIRELAKAGNEIHILTSRDQLRAKVTTQVLRTYYSGYIDSLTFTNQYVSESRFSGEKINKGLVSHALGADLHIDDHIKHGHDVLDMGVPLAFVFGEQPWNSNFNARPGLEKYVGWRPVVERVNELAAA
jgi:hypothetical protein